PLFAPAGAVADVFDRRLCHFRRRSLRRLHRRHRPLAPFLPHSRPGLGPDGGEYQSATQRTLSANRFKSTDIQGPTRKDSTPRGSSVTGEYTAETRTRARATQTSTKGKARPAGL